MNKYQILKRYFGYDSFRSGQEEVINHILQNKDVVAIMPTGAGKSLCYQIPAMLLPGITIVISPLISLMNDQVTTLAQQGIPAACINGSLTTSEYFQVVREVTHNAIKILYVAPERLLTKNFLSAIQDIDISMVTVDEAHCVSQWGHDFRPSYLDIPTLVSMLPKRPIVSVFTATATKQVKNDMESLLKLQNPFVLVNGFDRKNLTFEVQEPKDKDEALLTLLKRFFNKSGIIYCSTRKAVDKLFDLLIQKEYQVTRYHAGLQDEERNRNQEDFLFDRKTIMIATNAFGMGIDKSNVSFVIHYNMPKNMESYYQEAGRAGRDGEEATCILLFGGRDIYINNYLIEHSADDSETPDPVRIRLEKEKLSQMVAYAQSKTCLRANILRYFGETPKPMCGNCSVCDIHYESKDITIRSQKILSCVFRMHDATNTGINMDVVIDVLLGIQSEVIRNLGFQSLSTYGIMKDDQKEDVKKILEYLVEQGYLCEDENHTISLDKKAGYILVEKKSLSMKVVKDKTAKSMALSVEEAKLLESLKQLRLQIAQEQKVAPTVIFTDSTLRAMAKYAPETLSQLNLIPGIGFVKINKYGKRILAVIQKDA